MTKLDCFYLTVMDFVIVGMGIQLIARMLGYQATDAEALLNGTIVLLFGLMTLLYIPKLLRPIAYPALNQKDRDDE